MVWIRLIERNIWIKAEKLHFMGQFRDLSGCMLEYCRQHKKKRIFRCYQSNRTLKSGFLSFLQDERYIKIAIPQIG